MSSSTTTESAAPLRVVEFFSGIGGLHYGLRELGVAHSLVRAYDLDDVAVAVYKHNFAGTPVSTKNIVSLKSRELEELRADCWLLSPPCQPHSRQGLQLGELDGRSSALAHLVGLLDAGDEEMLPTSLLLENVVGFESSAMRARLHAVLSRRGYAVREVWASPAQLGIPNQRTRYFMLASRAAAGLPPPAEPIASMLLDPTKLDEARESGERLPPPRGEVDPAVQAACRPLGAYLLPAGDERLGELRITEAVLDNSRVAVQHQTPNGR